MNTKCRLDQLTNNQLIYHLQSLLSVQHTARAHSFDGMIPGSNHGWRQIEKVGLTPNPETLDRWNLQIKVITQDIDRAQIALMLDETDPEVTKVLTLSYQIAKLWAQAGPADPANAAPAVVALQRADEPQSDPGSYAWVGILQPNGIRSEEHLRELLNSLDPRAAFLPGSRLPGPIKSPTLPMPSQDRLRLHQTEVPSPTLRPEAAKPDPQDSIRSPEGRMRIGAQRELELMAEDQVLEREIPARSNRSDERPQHKEE